MVKTARYSLPLCDTDGLLTMSVVLVAPETGFQVEPLLVLTCHCTVGVGLPLPAAVNVASFPYVTVLLLGFVVTDAAVHVAAATELMLKK